MNPDDPLPPGWCWTTLETVAEVEGGITKDQKRRATLPVREVPYLRVANVQRGYLDLAVLKTIAATEGEIAALRLVPGDVLFTEGGDRDKLGRGWVWSGELDECIHQNHIFRARPNTLLVVPKLLSMHGNHFGQQWFTNTGKQTTNLASINKKVLRSFPVPLPPLAEQRRIVAKLEELFADLDEGTAALRRVQAKLKRYRAVVLRAAVDGSLTADWRAAHPAAEPATVLLARIRADRRRRWEDAQRAKFAAAGKEPKGWQGKYADPAAPDPAGLPPLPEAWAWAAVEQLSHFARYGSSAKTSAATVGVPVLRMGNIQNGQLDTAALKYLPHDHDEFPDLLLDPGDLLFNRTNSMELVGKSAVYTGEPSPCSYASYLIAVRFVEGYRPELASYFLNSSAGRAWIASVASQQVGQANVNGSKLLALALPLPPAAEQAAIVAEVERRLTVADAVAAQVDANLRRAGRLRQGVLKRAFEGKLVPQDPADEPAAVPLERLRVQRPTTAVRRRKGGAA